MEYNQLSKTIFLTFDDGPNEPYTSQILDVLSASQIKATFFVCGKNIEKNPVVLQRIAAAGHAIGIHSYSHNLSKVLKGDLIEEVKLTRDLIRRYTNIDTKLCRSPWGITRSKLKDQLSEQGYKLIEWDIMAFDWWKPTPEYIAKRVIKKAFSGAIILLHDGNGIKKGNRANTVAALPIILKTLSEEGYIFASLSM
jgi:peptidoglycan/xylan/chitin deacetylase (PgdA/CDA1 family)